MASGVGRSEHAGSLGIRDTPRASSPPSMRERHADRRAGNGQARAMSVCPAPHQGHDPRLQRSGRRAAAGRARNPQGGAGLWLDPSHSA